MYLNEVYSLMEWYQYKMFMRGGYFFHTDTTYNLFMRWSEGGTVNAYFTGENGYHKELLVNSGKLIALTVPDDGLYRIEVPLEGVTMTGLEFKVSVDMS